MKNGVLSRGRTIKLYLSIIFATVLFPYISFVFSQITLSLFNPALKKTLQEHLLNAFDFSSNLVFISLAVIIILIVFFRVQPLLYSLRTGQNREKARRIITELPLAIIVIDAAALLGGVSFFYLVFAKVTTLPYQWSLLIQLSGGLIGSLFMVQFLSNLLLEYKIALGMTGQLNKGKDIYSRLKSQMIFIGVVFFIITNLSYMARYYSQVPPQDYVISYLAVIIIYSLFLMVFSLLLVALARREHIRQVNFLRNRLIELTRGEGDLRERIVLINYDEVGDIVMSINHFLDFFSQFVHTVSQFSEKTAASAFELQYAIQENESHSQEFDQFMKDIIQSIEAEQQQVEIARQTIDEMLSMLNNYQGTMSGQIAAIDKTTENIQKMAENLTEITQSIEKTRKNSDSLKIKTNLSSEALRNFVSSIKKIQSSSSSVLEIVESISNIAETTNILALNASIEASHAGAAGKGFSTVAGEIKQLARQSSAAAKSIISHIKLMNQRILQGIRVMEGMQTALESMFPMINDISLQIARISENLSEDKVGVHQILETSQSLKESSGRMQSILQSQQDKSTEISATVETLSQASLNTRNMIEEIYSHLSSMVDVNTQMSEVSNINQNNTNKILEITGKFRNNEYAEAE